MVTRLTEGLTEEQNKQFSRMMQTIRTKQRRNRLRTTYRDSLERLDQIGFSIPPIMEDFQTAIGWADKAIKVPARRIRPDGFTLARPSRVMNEIEDYMGDPFIQSIEKQALDATMEHSVSFVFVTRGDTSIGEPEVVTVARTATEATCEVDIRSGRTMCALEIVSKQKYLYYIPGEVLVVELEDGDWGISKRYNSIPGKVPCTPIVWGKSLRRPFGKSRITRPLMGYIDQGVRTMLRQEVNAEFYGSPQRALMGADEAHFTDSNGNRIDPLSALIGGVWGLPDIRDEETGDLVRPKLEQLVQATFTPHGEMLRGIALMVSSETSIPVGYLGVIHDNPSSADAIRASESDLVSVITDELPSIGASRVDIARNVAAYLEDGWSEALEKELRGLQSHFRDPGTPTKAEQADAGLKYKSTFPDGDPEVAMEIYGLSRLQIERNLAYQKRMQAQQSMADLLLAAQQQPQQGQVQQGQQQPQQGQLQLQQGASR